MLERLHVEHFLVSMVAASLVLTTLVVACTAQLCIDNEAGEWVFAEGRWLHCDSWIAACDMAARAGAGGDAGACVASARSLGCKP